MRGVPLVAGTWSQCGWAGRLLRLKLERALRKRVKCTHDRSNQSCQYFFPRRWQGSNLIGRFLRAQANKQKATFRYAAAASVATIPEPRYLVAIDQLPMPLLFRLPPLSLTPTRPPPSCLLLSWQRRRRNSETGTASWPTRMLHRSLHPLDRDGEMGLERGARQQHAIAIA
jgi:hypothetical protein